MPTRDFKERQRLRVWRRTNIEVTLPDCHWNLRIQLNQQINFLAANHKSGDDSPGVPNALRNAVDDIKRWCSLEAMTRDCVSSGSGQWR